MVHFITVFASALSLLSFTHAATIDTRECSYTCPATLRDGTGELVYSMKDNNGLLQCYYVIESADPTSYNCPYDLVGHISLSNFQL